ncbi:MAG: NAD(P)/FAD-dependent oxidoreductase [Frankiaceae bacterium]
MHGQDTSSVGTDESRYEVIVVGARCAGAATAMLLARAGHRVLVVDRARFPSDRLSTHALLPAGVFQLHRWGLLDAVRDSGAPAVPAVTTDVVGSVVRRPVAVSGIDALYAPRRTVLDHLLLRAAEAAGVQVRTGVSIDGLLREAAGRVVGVAGRQGGRQVEFHARITVGADGVRSTVAQLAGAPAYRSHPPLNATHYAYFTGIGTSDYVFAFDPSATAGIIPTNNGAACVFVGCPSEQAPEGPTDGATGRHPYTDAGFARLLADASPMVADQVSAGTRVSPYRGTAGLPGFLRRPYGDGWALVGDAGYHRDPLSAHGITDAFRDAELLARALHATLGGEADEVGALSGYQAVRDEHALPVYEAARELAGYRWDGARAIELLSGLGRAGRHEVAMLATLPRWPGDVAGTVTGEVRAA